MVKKQLTEFQQPPAKEIVIDTGEKLTLVEQQELFELEATIRDGLRTFIQVGEALQTVREKRLYRSDYASFEAYCQERWQMGRQYAYRLIGGAEVAGNLVSSIGDTALPQKEAHTRELSKLAPEAQPVAWLKAVQAAGSVEAVTAEIVSRAVDEVLGKVGRFEAKLWYAVDGRRHIIYDEGSKEYGGDKGSPLHGFNPWIQGGQLNKSKEYDGFQLVPVPTLEAVPITEKLPSINVSAKRWGEETRHYPVNAKKSIIYDDPVLYEQRGEKRYPQAEFVSEAEIVAGWASLQTRYFEFTIRPPDPTIDWTKGAFLQPGKFMRCYHCDTEHPYAEMVAGVHGEFWTCPNGHILRDEEYRVREKPSEPAVTQQPPVTPAPPTTPAGTFDDEDDETLDDIFDVLDEVASIDTILEYIFDNVDDVTEALKPENVQAFNEDEFGLDRRLSETGREFLLKMLETAKAAKDAQNASA